MAEESTTQAVDPSLVARIVRSYVAQNTIDIDQLEGLISTVHRALSGLGKSAARPAPLVPAVSIRRSVQRDHVVCLECGFLSQMLRRHLRVAHGLEPAEYRVRWKLLADHPITAPTYSERRSTMAKRIGLGRRPMTVLKGYFDDSGDDNNPAHQHNAFVLAGYVADVESWKTFETLWRAVLDKHQVPYSHMRELAHFRGPYKNGRMTKAVASPSSPIWLAWCGSPIFLVSAH
jgi:predicted transcriptional regulator